MVELKTKALHYLSLCEIIKDYRLAFKSRQVRLGGERF
jgi:hypothetical protein